MSFSAETPVANIAAARSALAAQGYSPDAFITPIWTTGPQPTVATLYCLPNMPAFRAACAALPGAVVRDYGQLVKNMNATATAAGGRWGGNAPLLQGNVTPGLYRAIEADGGALWWVIQAFDRNVFNGDLLELAALVRMAREPGVVTAWVQPIDQFNSYQAVNAFTGLPDRVTHSGKEWDCLIANNVNEPGVANWREFVEGGYPAWLQPTGAGDAYPVGFRVTHLGQNWQNNSPANTFEPGVFGWVVI